jgi:hypothetical protein
MCVSPNYAVVLTAYFDEAKSLNVVKISAFTVSINGSITLDGLVARLIARDKPFDVFDVAYAVARNETNRKRFIAIVGNCSTPSCDSLGDQVISTLASLLSRTLELLQLSKDEEDNLRLTLESEFLTQLRAQIRLRWLFRRIENVTKQETVHSDQNFENDRKLLISLACMSHKFRVSKLISAVQHEMVKSSLQAAGLSEDDANVKQQPSLAIDCNSLCPLQTAVVWQCVSCGEVTAKDALYSLDQQGIEWCQFCGISYIRFPLF